jgi:hypothetical protein
VFSPVQGRDIVAQRERALGEKIASCLGSPVRGDINCSYAAPHGLGCAGLRLTHGCLAVGHSIPALTGLVESRRRKYVSELVKRAAKLYESAIVSPEQVRPVLSMNGRGSGCGTVPARQVC